MTANGCKKPIFLTVRLIVIKRVLLQKDTRNKKALIIMTLSLLLQNLSQFVHSFLLLLLKNGLFINWMSIMLSFKEICLPKYICASPWVLEKGRYSCLSLKQINLWPQTSFSRMFYEVFFCPLSQGLYSISR